MLQSWWTRPFFLVQAQYSGREPRRTAPETATFRLQQTFSHRMMVGCGLAATGFPLFALSPVFELSFFFLALLSVCVLFVRICHFANLPGATRWSQESYFSSPHPSKVQTLLVWQLFWVTLLLLTAAQLASNLTKTDSCCVPTSSDCRISTLNLDVPFCLEVPFCFLLLGVALTLGHALLLLMVPSFNLHGLTSWYRRLPIPVRRLVWLTTSVPPPYPSQSWRSVNDLSQELNAAGVAIMLFGERGHSPIWKERVRIFWSYLAPISLPFVCLMLLPPIAKFAALGGDHLPVRLAGCAIAWGAWSISFFLHFGNRDFLRLPRFGTDPNPNPTLLLADIMAHPNYGVREQAAEYFQRKGKPIFNVIVIALIPAYFSYIGLFSL